MSNEFEKKKHEELSIWKEAAFAASFLSKKHFSVKRGSLSWRQKVGKIGLVNYCV